MTNAKLAGATALALILSAIVTSADARTRHQYQYRHYSPAYSLPDDWDRLDQRYDRSPTWVVETRKRKRHTRVPRVHRRHIHRHPHAVRARSAHHRIARAPTITGYSRQIAKTANLSAVASGLAAKVRELMAACPGTRIASAYRPGARVAGTGRPSLHSRYPAEAVDLAGSPKCLYGHLHGTGWPGGYSVDYAAVRHLHLSLASDGRERGARFVHHSGHRRYAMRHRKYAVR